MGTSTLPTSTVIHTPHCSVLLVYSDNSNKKKNTGQLHPRLSGGVISDPFDQPRKPDRHVRYDSRNNRRSIGIMSRSAADATRFTATGPYASSKPGSPAYKLPGSMLNSGKPNANANSNNQNASQGQPGETPQQKVERLRAQARAARIAQSSSGIDRFLDAGREVANKAHKVMVYSLIAASGMSRP